MIIYGIEDNDKDEDCVKRAQGFFRHQMGIKQAIPLKKAHRPGKGKNRPMKVILSNTNDKSAIYNNVRNLQDKCNSNNKKYRIEDELPPPIRAAKKKACDLAWHNNKSVADQLVMSVKKGKLLLNNDEYEHQIIKPKPQLLLKLTPDEVQAIETIGESVAEGTPVEHKTSSFTGYVADVDTYDDVNKAYKYVQY